MGARTDELRSLLARNLSRADQLAEEDPAERLRRVLACWSSKHRDLDVLDRLQALGQLHDQMTEYFEPHGLAAVIDPDHQFAVMLGTIGGLPLAVQVLAEQMQAMLDEYQEAHPDAV